MLVTCHHSCSQEMLFRKCMTLTRQITIRFCKILRPLWRRPVLRPGIKRTFSSAVSFLTVAHFRDEHEESHLQGLQNRKICFLNGPTTFIWNLIRQKKRRTTAQQHRSQQHVSRLPAQRSKLWGRYGQLREPLEGSHWGRVALFPAMANYLEFGALGGGM